MGETVLLSYARTAFGKFGGALRDVSGVDLAAAAVAGALARSGLDPAEVDEVFGGCCAQAEAGVIAPVIARRALMKADSMEINETAQAGAADAGRDG